MATTHRDEYIINDDCKLMCDLDMSILGQDWYDEYAKQIELEFTHDGLYSLEDFKSGRKKFLNGLLDKSIYRTKYFIDKFEEKALNNIRKELEKYV